MVSKEKPKRRKLSDIEAELRDKGTIGCRCLCPILHPGVFDICRGAAQRKVSLFKGQDQQIQIAMCEPCAALHG